MCSPPQGAEAPPRVRAAAIIPRNGAVALIRRQRAGRTYYVFPGGAVEADETPEQAAVREALEELGLVIEIRRLLADVLHGDERQFYFLADPLGGQLGTGTRPEVLGLYPPAQGTYTPLWMPFERMAEVAGWPRLLFERVAQTPETGCPCRVLVFEDQGQGLEAP